MLSYPSTPKTNINKLFVFLNHVCCLIGQDLYISYYRGFPKDANTFYSCINVMIHLYIQSLD